MWESASSVHNLDTNCISALLCVSIQTNAVRIEVQQSNCDNHVEVHAMHRTIWTIKSKNNYCAFLYINLKKKNQSNRLQLFTLLEVQREATEAMAHRSNGMDWARALSSCWRPSPRVLKYLDRASTIHWRKKWAMASLRNGAFARFIAVRLFCLNSFDLCV